MRHPREALHFKDDKFMPCMMREHLRGFDPDVIPAGGRRQGTGITACAYNPFCKMPLTIFGPGRGFHGSTIVMEPTLKRYAFNPAGNGQPSNFIY